MAFPNWNSGTKIRTTTVRVINRQHAFFVSYIDEKLLLLSQVFSRVGDMVGIKYFPADPNKQHSEESRVKLEWIIICKCIFPMLFCFIWILKSERNQKIICLVWMNYKMYILSLKEMVVVKMLSSFKVLKHKRLVVTT